MKHRVFLKNVFKTKHGFSIQWAFQGEKKLSKKNFGAFGSKSIIKTTRWNFFKKILITKKNQCSQQNPANSQKKCKNAKKCKKRKFSLPYPPLNQFFVRPVPSRPSPRKSLF